MLSTTLGTRFRPMKKYMQNFCLHGAYTCGQTNSRQVNRLSFLNGYKLWWIVQKTKGNKHLGWWRNGYREYLALPKQAQWTLAVQAEPWRRKPVTLERAWWKWVTQKEQCASSEQKRQGEKSFTSLEMEDQCSWNQKGERKCGRTEKPGKPEPFTLLGTVSSRYGGCHGKFPGKGRI